MDKQPLAAASSSSSHVLAQRLYDKNIDLENKRRKSAQARVPSDPNTWHQMRENFETIILEDHTFSEKHTIEFALWQLHYRRIEEFRAHYSAASQPRGPGGPARASKIRLQFKTFLSEATGFYHDLILKIRAKYGLPIGQFYPEQDDQQNKDGKKSIQIKKGLISCHRCLIYLGDLARYKGLYGEGESKSRDYAAASSYYLQAASLWPSSGNPHHQLAILATYSGDELMAVYRYFRSLAAEHPFSTARDNLIVAFEKNRQSHTQLHADSNGSVKELPVRTKGRGRGKVDPVARSKEPVTDTDVDIAAVTLQTFKAFRVSFVRLNGILFTHTSLEAFEEILSLVTNALQELLSYGPEDEPRFGTDAEENGLFIVILVSILIFTVNNVRGGTEGLSYADIVQNTVLLKNALTTFYEVIGQLLKRCIELNDPSSSFLLPGILVCVEWIACHSDVVISKETDEKSTAQTKFWGYCVSLFNKLLSAGLVSYDDDEDLSCFTDMTQYEEGENEYQSALWEDFELRGFLPLEPAHMFLDFSRKHSDNKKDKLARVKRILTAGKVIVDKITIDNKKVRFDSKLNKFVIGVEMKDTGSSKLQVVKQLKMDSHVEGEGEDEDEVIVFKPNLIDNRAEMLSLKEGFENLQNIDVGSGQSSQSIIHQLDTVYVSSQSHLPVNNYTQQPVNISYNIQNIGQPVNSSCNTQNVGQPVNSSYNTQNVGQPVNSSYNTQNIGQPYQFQSSLWSGGLQGLTLMENGQPEMQREMQISNAGFGMMYTGPSHTPEPDPYLVGRNTSFNMPTSSLKVSTNRPIRHLGPPPGFTSVRPNKPVSESNFALGQNQNLLNDDYSWLDGYQLQSSMKSGVQPVNLPSNRSSQYVNDSVATSCFPFSGRQVPVVRFEGETQKNLESSHTHHQQQYVTQLDQQGQPVWKANHFV